MSSHDQFHFPKAALRPATNPWCCLASIPAPETDENSKSSVIIEIIANGYTNGIQNEQNTDEENKYEVEVVENGNPSLLDLTVPSDWMEYIQLSENRKDEDGGGGAYDCLRCDYIILHNGLNQSDCTDTTPLGDGDNNKDDTEWRIWGKEFHLNRLKNSYLSLFESNPQHNAHLTEESIQFALIESSQLIESLLNEAKKSALFSKWQSETSFVQSDDNVESYLVALEKVTLLWSPPINKLTTGSNKIIVRGHACSSGRLIKVTDGYTKPIICSVAARVHFNGRSNQQDNESKIDNEPKTRDKVSSMEYDGSMPTRFDNPQRKVAAWTKLRKQMESPSTYKPSYAGEVLMVRPRLSDGELELLEGVSSNFFVLYIDGTLRTASDGVLHGYVRHIVLEAARFCKIPVETEKPIMLRDGENGLWEEAFITSSSRLIMPISKIFVSSTEKLYDDSSFLQFWQDPILTADDSACKQKPKQVWKTLLHEILRRNGRYYE